MLIRVVHETRYRYAREVGFGRHRLVLRPREGHDLALTQHELTVEPAHTLSWIRDVHDNVIALVDFHASAAALTFINRFHVRRIAPFPLESDDLATGPESAVSDEREAALVNAYRRPNFEVDFPAVQDWARSHSAIDPASTVLSLCRAVHTNVQYRRRLEKGVQTPVQTLEAASGSCRDMATLLMEAARALGLAARFVSGYLHGSASLAGRASTHAWAEVYLPARGWRGVDPTLGTVTDVRHVPVGVHQHPRGVMPVTGTFTGSAADLLEHSVSVTTDSDPKHTQSRKETA